MPSYGNLRVWCIAVLVPSVEYSLSCAQSRLSCLYQPGLAQSQDFIVVFIPLFWNIHSPSLLIHGPHIQCSYPDGSSSWNDTPSSRVPSDLAMRPYASWCWSIYCMCLCNYSERGLTLHPTSTLQVVYQGMLLEADVRLEWLTDNTIRIGKKCFPSTRDSTKATSPVYPSPL